MAWNEPDGPGDKDPWGRKRDQGPPDLDQIVKNIQNKLAGVFGSKRGGGAPAGAGKAGIGLIAVVVALLWLVTGTYIIQPGESGVELRFGRKTEVNGPGLHWHLPFPIESKEVVNTERISTLELGYRRNEKTLGVTKVPKEALMLTEDENIIDIEFALRYKIKDPMAFLFNVADPSATIAQAMESAVREAVGKSRLDFVLTEGRAEVEQSVRASLQEMLDRYQSGVHVVTVEMQKALPPQEVKAAFDDAVKAREDEQRLINEAEAYSNDVIPRARGAAARILEESQAYRASVIARAEGDAERFNQIMREYVKAPRVTRQRLYIEAMEHILSTTTKVFVDQKNGNNVLYLPLDRMGTSSQPPTPALRAPEEEEELPAASEPLRDRQRDTRRRGG